MAKQARRRISESVRAGNTPIGIFVTSVDPAASTIMGAAGFDFVILDCEHGPMDKVTALQHIRAAGAWPMLTFIRTLEATPQSIQAYFDIGANGVMVPKIETAEQARRAVAASRYQPGGRGMCPGCESALYSSDTWLAHVAEANDGNIIIPLIETRAGMANLKEIVAVEGVELVMFGPGDLSQDLGLDLFTQKEQLYGLWADFAKTVHDAGKLAMVPAGFDFEGADVLVNSMDLKLLRTAADQIVARHRATPAA